MWRDCTGYLRKPGKAISIKYQEVGAMLFEDNQGRILMPDEVDELSVWEIEERGIHVCGNLEA